MLPSFTLFTKKKKESLLSETVKDDKKIINLISNIELVLLDVAFDFKNNEKLNKFSRLSSELITKIKENSECKGNAEVVARIKYLSIPSTIPELYKIRIESLLNLVKEQLGANFNHTASPF